MFEFVRRLYTTKKAREEKEVSALIIGPFDGLPLEVFPGKDGKFVLGVSDVGHRIRVYPLAENRVMIEVYQK